MNKLQREAVIRTALELLNDVGMEGLTTRRLAERLGVQQPALYWHFKNKRALLDALAEAMLTINHTHSTPRDDDDWRSFLKGNACSFRRALLAYRDGARIHAGTRPAAPQMEKADAQLRFLCDAGFSAGDATYALMAISYFTVGAVLEQQASEADAEERGEDQLTTSASVTVTPSSLRALPTMARTLGLSSTRRTLMPRRRSLGRRMRKTSWARVPGSKFLEMKSIAPSSKPRRRSSRLLQAVMKTTGMRPRGARAKRAAKRG